MTIDPISFETPDTEGAAARASDLLQQINASRTLARTSGDPNADTIGADAERVAKDSIALANAIEHGKTLGSAVVVYFPSDMAPGAVLGAVSRLRLTLAGPVSASAPPSDAEAPRAAPSTPPPAPPSDDRQLSSQALGGAPPAPAGAPADAASPAAEGSARREESAIPIDTWEPTKEQIDDLPFDPAWVRNQLPDFKDTNKGQTAKRWITSFRAWLGKRPEADAHKRPAES